MTQILNQFLKFFTARNLQLHVKSHVGLVRVYRHYKSPSVCHLPTSSKLHSIKPGTFVKCIRHFSNLPHFLWGDQERRQSWNSRQPRERKNCCPDSGETVLSWKRGVGGSEGQLLTSRRPCSVGANALEISDTDTIKLLNFGGLNLSKVFDELVWTARSKKARWPWKTAIWQQSFAHCTCICSAVWPRGNVHCKSFLALTGFKPLFVVEYKEENKVLKDWHWFYIAQFR
jgi:hypothetical protein